MKSKSNFTLRRAMTVCLSAVLALCLVIPASGFRVFAMTDPPASWTELAKKHIPQHLRITLHGIEKREGYSVVTGNAEWDDDEEITECEFNPGVWIGNAYARPKCTAWTLVKRTGDAGNSMPEDVMYDAKNGVCSKSFEIVYLEENEENEVEELDSGERYAHGVKMNDKLRFAMTSVVQTNDYAGESPESEIVEFTLTEDVFGKTFTAGSNSDNEGGVCKWCGEVHSGFFGSIKGFFHDIFYFFAHLFD